MKYAWTAGLWCLLGCDVDQVLVATFPVDAGEDAGKQTLPDASVLDAGPPQPACRTNEDCALDAYCQKDRCDAAIGQCARRPTICAPDPSPVCGCDGITYFNDCLRQQSGMASAFSGDCPRELAVRCADDSDLRCPSSSFCALLVPAGVTCPSELLGTCWVIPECDSNVPRGGERFSRCDDTPEPDDDKNDDCVDACRAIRSEKPHVRRFRCTDDRGPSDRSGRTEP